MDPMTFLQSIPGVGPAIPYITLAITIAAALAVVAPGPTAAGFTNTGFYRFVYAVLQWCALNKLHATPLSSPAATGIVGGGGAVGTPQMATGSVPAASPSAATLKADAAAGIPVSTIGQKP